MTFIETPVHISLDEKEVKAIKTTCSVLDNILDRIDYSFVLEKNNKGLNKEIEASSLLEAINILTDFL